VKKFHALIFAPFNPGLNFLALRGVAGMAFGPEVKEDSARRLNRFSIVVVLVLDFAVMS
jgi:hypothetical protein